LGDALEQADVDNLFSIPNLPLGEIADFEDMFRPLGEDQINLLEASNKDELDNVFDKVMKEWSDDDE